MKFNAFKTYVQETKYPTIVETIEALCDQISEDELYDHMEQVAELAVMLSDHYHLNTDDAYLTGFLHDVGRLIDPEEYLEILNHHGIEVTKEEMQVQDVLHGKVANIIAKEVFKIDSKDISDGILYHTTLRREASDFEKVIFLADKMTWTYDDLIYSIEETVFQSLNVACYNALDWIIGHLRQKNGLILETTESAYNHLKNKMLL